MFSESAFKIDQVTSMDAKMKGNLTGLYDEWLSHQGTRQVVQSVTQTDAELYTLPPLPKHHGSSSSSAASEQRSISPSLGASPLQSAHDIPQREIQIPPFYFPNGPPPSAELKEKRVSEIVLCFSNAPDGLPINDADANFKTITKEVCQLPSFFSAALFRKIDNDSTGWVTRDKFIRYWIEGNMLSMDKATQIYRILKQPDREYLSQDDFMPILKELLKTHPHLGMLKRSPKIQKRYAETVIYRIFYHINIKGDGRLTLSELKRGNLIASMEFVDEEQDIDRDLRYFSYKHFYVIFCTFGNVDRNHDFLIEKGDIIRYARCSLTPKIVERIFSQAPRRFTSGVEGKMNYEDFVYFFLSEVDKSTEPSIKYWFKCLDVDENEVLTPGDLQVIYGAQRTRMLCNRRQPMSDEDMFRRIVDMIGPETPEFITLRDLKRSKFSGHAFDMLFNLTRWKEFRSLEGSSERNSNPDLTDWDLFAEQEYARMKKEAQVLPDSDGEDSNDEDSKESFWSSVLCCTKL